MEKKSSKVLISTLALLLLVSFSGVANADTEGVNDQPIIPTLSQEQIKTENVSSLVKSAKSLQKIINQGNQLINERLTALNKQNKKIQKSKLTVGQKASLTTLVNQNITSLTALNVQIKADKATSTAKLDVQSIYTNFRIFAVFIPKTNLVIDFDLQQNHLDSLATYFAKVQTRINTAQAKGANVTARQKALDDAKALVPSIQNKLKDAISKVSNLKPSDYPTTSKTVITDANKSLREIRQSLVTLNKTVKKAK